MNKTQKISWLIWLLLVILWNYGYPAASPLLDISATVFLSIFNVVFLKFIEK